MDAAEQWEPDDARVSRPVLRERGGETPPRHSPGSSDRRQAILALASGRRRRRGSRSAGAAATRQDCSRAAMKLMRKLLKNQHNGSCPFMPQSRTRSTSNAISFPAIRSALSEAKCFRIGGRRLRPEQEPSLGLFVRTEPSSRDNPDEAVLDRCGLGVQAHDLVAVRACIA